MLKVMQNETAPFQSYRTEGSYKSDTPMECLWIGEAAKALWGYNQRGGGRPGVALTG